MLNQLLTQIFDFFHKNNIRFVILRNYKELPYKLNKYSDIDFLIDSNSYKKINKLILKIENFEILTYIKRSYVKEIYCLFNKSLTIKLDFHKNEGWKGAIYLTGETILNNRIPYKNFFIPNSLHEGMISLFSSLLYGGFIKDKYVENIKQSLSHNKIFLIDTFKKKIGEKNINDIWLFSKNYRTKDDLLKIRKSILFNLIIFNLKNNFYKYFSRVICHILFEIRLRIKKPGKLVVFIGTDGSGKSTLINIAKENFKNYFNKSLIKTFHLFPGSKEKKTICLDPHKEKAYGFIKNIVKDFYLLLRYWFGYFKLFNILSKNGVVIMDRYYYDVIIDPLRFRLTKKNYRKFLLHFIPKPDIVFYCYGDPQIIHYRKKELPISEITKQQKAILSLSKKQKNWIKIDTTNQDIYKCYQNITKALIKTLLSK